MKVLYWTDRIALGIGYVVLLMLAVAICCGLAFLLLHIVRTFMHLHLMYKHGRTVFKDPDNPPPYWRMWRWVFTQQPQFNLSDDECLNWPAKIEPRQTWPAG